MNQWNDTIDAMNAINMTTNMPINIINTADGLADCMAAAVRVGWMAMDTEFLRERTYSPELCLIQVTNDEASACIDPLAVDDLSPLGELLGNPAVVKIFHSCRQDLEAFDTRTATHAYHLYDTQLAAAFCGYGDQVSYAALVEAVCAVHLPKAHTRTDWSRRPLSDAQLEYAMDDVKYLHPLRLELDRLLAQKGRAQWHRDECIQATDPAHYRIDADDAWLRLRGVDRLDVAGQACARRLAAWREHKAQHRNLPRGWILPTPVLLQICWRRPDTQAKLAQIEGIGPSTVKRAGEEIIAVVAESKNHTDNASIETMQPIAPLPPILTIAQRRQVKEIMKLLEQRATQEEISRALIANRQEVENFVRGQTDLPLFSGWRAQFLGNEIRTRYT